MTAPILVWFRRDLRLADNPALSAAVATGRPVVPVYLLEDGMGAASRWWLHGSLEALGGDLARLGAPLVLRRGDPRKLLPALLRDAGAGEVLWNRVVEPSALAIDDALRADRIPGRPHDGAMLLHDPDGIRTGQGRPYRVYTPFWRRLAQDDQPPPLGPPRRLVAGPALAGDTLADWALRPGKPDWASGFRAEWRPGEAGARTRLADFLDGALAEYRTGRDRPDKRLTSRLSPHLHFGEIGPRQVWHATRLAAAAHGLPDSEVQKFLAELGWREFAHHLLFHFPHMAGAPLRPQFAHFPWRTDPQGLRAWQRGLTGYPIVDAGMRELWATGWMHNRVRMVAASFLVKHLLVRWQEGAAWFLDTLVDADLANNAAGWQWVAGSGADAAPYFRIFNPVLQGVKFDPLGEYVRRWVPELAQLPPRHVHQPWKAPDAVLHEAGIVLGEDYPRPIVDHDFARRRALEAYRAISGPAGGGAGGAED